MSRTNRSAIIGTVIVTAEVSLTRHSASLFAYNVVSSCLPSRYTKVCGMSQDLHVLWKKFVSYLEDYSMPEDMPKELLSLFLSPIKVIGVEDLRSVTYALDCEEPEFDMDKDQRKHYVRILSKDSLVAWVSKYVETQEQAEAEAEESHKKRRVDDLVKDAKKLGFTLIPVKGKK